VILDRHNRFVEDFHLSISEIDSPAVEHTPAIVALPKRWNVGCKMDAPFWTGESP